jgi:hypothetical protein
MLIVLILPLVIDEAKRIILVHLEISSYKRKEKKIDLKLKYWCILLVLIDIANRRQ